LECIFIILKNVRKVKKSPNMRKFAQSGHPDEHATPTPRLPAAGALN
jgi:hypothetical protein